MANWGKRKDGHSYPKDQSKKGVKGSSSSTSVGDIHLKSSQDKIAYFDINGKIHHSHPESIVTQTYLLSKDKFTKSEAIEWLKKHGKIHDLDETKPNYWRARQVSPTAFKEDEMKTFEIADGVLDVGGKLIP